MNLMNMQCQYRKSMKMFNVDNLNISFLTIDKKLMATLKVTDEKFEEQVLKNEKPVLVDFWAEWCGPCKMVGPILEEISEEMANDIVIAKHDIDSEPNMPTKYGVRGIPTMLLFKGGELKATKVGATPKSDIIAFIKENI